jgi:type IV secretory pathway TrbF-like protein
MRRVLLAVTVLLALVVAFASPLGELAVSLLAPTEPPVVLEPEPRCPPRLPEDPWWRSVGQQLGSWIEDARTVTAEPARAARLEAESLRMVRPQAEATLSAYFELRDAPRLAPPPAEVEAHVTDVGFCPGVPPVWEVAWTETRGMGAHPVRWRAVLRVEEIRIPEDYPPETHLEHPEGFLITDFDWGPVPTDPGAGRPAPPTLEEQTP